MNVLGTWPNKCPKCHEASKVAPRTSVYPECYLWYCSKRWVAAHKRDPEHIEFKCRGCSATILVATMDNGGHKCPEDSPI